MFKVALKLEDITRIFSKIQIDTDTGCWNWTGSISGGYGNVSYRGKCERTHRVLYAWTIGPIPQQLSRRGRRGHIRQLDHVVCQNRQCCNPAHLELVTQRVNILRGNAPNMQVARATHCRHGHLLPKNRTEKNGHGNVTRRCSICRKRQQRQAYESRKSRGYYLCG